MWSGEVLQRELYYHSSDAIVVCNIPKIFYPGNFRGSQRIAERKGCHMRKRIAVLLAGALIGMTGCGGVKVVSPEAGSSSQKAEFEKIKTPEE